MYLRRVLCLWRDVKFKKGCRRDDVFKEACGVLYLRKVLYLWRDVKFKKGCRRDDVFKEGFCI